MRGEFWAESTTLIKAREQVLKSPTVASPRAGSMVCSELAEEKVGQAAFDRATDSVQRWLGKPWKEICKLVA